MLEGEASKRVRGAVEQLYRLRRELAVIEAGTAASVPAEGHRQVFAVAMVPLLAEFIAYLDRPGADPAADLVGCRQHAMWLSQDELTSLTGEMRDVVMDRITNEPSPGRSRCLISPVLFPAEESPVANSEGKGRAFGCERAK
ncbi:ArsR family transcriptional regulator [Streptomyces globisporus]|uniref:ArsR family transcriptional regulator n=1 Tax=Streptomyces globisporus TaxID=1908 RepID=UPI00345FACD6|nr:ArsR family transcriptional regulator [Streptomyces globisporus]